jgi:hypothetical protein
VAVVVSSIAMPSVRKITGQNTKRLVKSYSNRKEKNKTGLNRLDKTNNSTICTII